MNVIIGIDDSPYSEAALKWVQSARWPEHARFIVVSAVEVLAYALIESGGTTVYSQLEQDQLRLHQKLAENAKSHLEKGGFTAGVRVAFGDPRRILLEAAETEKADLVIVGSHGRSGLPKLLMGSVASHVVTHAPCSVLVVKRPGDRKT